MRIKHIALFAAAAIASLSSVAAEPVVAADTVTVRAAPAKKLYVDPLVFKRVQGEYKLDDGRTLAITSKGRKLYADVGDGPSELVHIGNDRFEAIGKDLGVRFDDPAYPRDVFVKSGPQRQVASSAR